MKAAEICNPAWDIWKLCYGDAHENFSWMHREHTSMFGPNYADRLEEGRVEYNRVAVGSMMLKEFGWHSIRSVVIDHMTFAIPDPESLDVIAQLGPIVEMGAGTGYWAWCLRQMGIDVVAYDRFPPQTHPRPDDSPRGGREKRESNGWFQTYWTDVKRGYPNALSRHADRALLMVWPYMNSMAERALKHYRGDTLIYVGEERAACANDAFFNRLDRDWEKVEDRLIPQWAGMHDELWVLRRKR